MGSCVTAWLTTINGISVISIMTPTVSTMAMPESSRWARRWLSVRRSRLSREVIGLVGVVVDVADVDARGQGRGRTGRRDVGDERDRDGLDAAQRGERGDGRGELRQDATRVGVVLEDDTGGVHVLAGDPRLRHPVVRVVGCRAGIR